MCLRVSEVRQHTVSHVLRDEAACLDNLLGAAAVIRANDLAQVLGIEASGESGRADEIAEHDRELATFGGCCGVRERRCGCNSTFPRQRPSAVRAEPRASPAGRAAGGATHGKSCAARFTKPNV